MRNWERKRCVLTCAILIAMLLGTGSAGAADRDQDQPYGQTRDRSMQDQYGQQQQQQQPYGGQTQQPRGTQQGRTPAMAQQRNQQLEQQVANQLRQQGLGEQGQMMVLAVGNELILLGTVRDENSKQQAEQIARQVSGIQRVDNRLQVQQQTQRLSDTQLRQSIQQQLPGNLAQNIQIQVQNGRVTLQGRVNDWRAMADAISAAYAAGAWQVNSQLSVSGAQYDTRTGRAASRWQRSAQDQQLEQRLESQLRSQIPGVESLTVLVAGNKAFLLGRVRSEEAREQAGDLAEQTPGVERVDNGLTVAAEGWQQQDDATIQNEVRDELWWSPYVDSDDIQITVNNGAVTLSGQVANFGEMAAAIENAYEGGARTVQNRLQITQRVGAARPDYDYGWGFPPYGYVPGDEDQMEWQDREDRMQAGIPGRDMRLEQQIASRLRQQGYGARGEIMILATGNRIILLGTVPDNKTKEGVERAAQQIATRQSIDNRLHVHTQARRVSDAQLERNTNNRLSDQLSENIQVQARNGTVTLQGQLDDWWQVADAIDAAFAAGASQVNSQFSVAGAGPMARGGAAGSYPSYGYTPGQQRQRPSAPRSRQDTMGAQRQATGADLRLAQQVADQLRQQLPQRQNVQPIQPQSIYVTVQQGTVTLHGYVQSSSQKQEAQQIVQSIRGVRNVRNDLTILSTRGATGQAGGQGQWQDQGDQGGWQGQEEQSIWQGQSSRGQSQQQDFGNQDQYSQSGQGGIQQEFGAQSQYGQGAQMGAGQARMSASDMNLAQQIVQQLRQQLSGIQNVQIARPGTIYVMAAQGTVMLHGSVQSANISQQATQIARAVPGVQNIQSTLRAGAAAGGQAYGYVPGQEQEQGQQGAAGQDRQGQNQGMMGRNQGTQGSAQMRQIAAQRGRTETGRASQSDMMLAHQAAQKLWQQLTGFQNIQIMTPGTIYVKASNGTITLDGFVSDNRVKQQAEQVVKSITGVQNVQNSLKIAPAGTAIGFIPGAEDESKPFESEPSEDELGDEQDRDQNQEDWSNEGEPY